MVIFQITLSGPVWSSMQLMIMNGQFNAVPARLGLTPEPYRIGKGMLCT